MRLIKLLLRVLYAWPLLLCNVTLANSSPEQLPTIPGSVDVVFVKHANGSESWLHYEISGELSVTEGDIVLKDSPKGRRFASQTSAQGIGVVNMGNLWPYGIVPYSISDFVGNELRDRIMEAINHWRSFTRIHFVERNSSNAAEYSDYLEFVSGPGCASHVGRVGGRQSVWVAGNCDVGNIIHEIGHAVGMYHEHVRSDRDNYIQILWNNIETDKYFNFEQPQTNFTNHGDYDFASIMHYGAYHYSRNGNVTIQTIPDSMPIGQRDGLSAGDIEAIDLLYRDVPQLQVEIGETTHVAQNDGGGGGIGVYVMIILLPLLRRLIKRGNNNAPL